MSLEHLQPAYQIIQYSSKAEESTWSSIEQACKEIANGWIVLWQYHTVFTGKIENGGVAWLEGEHPEPSDAHLVRLRAFNKVEELHFWRSGQEIKGRLRMDGKGDSVDCIDTSMVLRAVVGEKIEPKLGDGKKYAILTRNYIGYHPVTHQAGYVDSRFVGFEPKIEKQ